MADRLLQLCLTVIPLALAACCGDMNLNGPVDYESENGFAAIDTAIHFDPTGAATKVITVHAGAPTTTHGTVSAAALEQLRSDIAATDLDSFRGAYSCSDFPCGADAPFDTMTITVDGKPVTITVDRNIDDARLPAGLVKILGDLADIARQLP